MNSYFSAPVIWFIIGFVLFLLEFVLPGFIVFFFGFGAWVVAVILLMTDLPINAQILVFLGTSLLSVLLFRKWIRAKLGMRSADKGQLTDEIIGKTAKAETPILPGQQGKVYFKGATWSATSTDIINTGEEVLITGNDSILLIVKSLKQL